MTDYLGPYELNSIITGECSALMAALPDGCIDLTVTSPPYDNLRNYNGYVFPFEDIARQLYRVTKPGGVVVWVVADATINFCESLSSFKQAIFFVERCGFNLLDTMIWHKENAPKGYENNLKYTSAAEYMFILVKGKPKTFNPIKDRVSKLAGYVSTASKRQRNGNLRNEGTYTVKETHLRHNVWGINVGSFAGDGGGFCHPASFPEALARDHIISWSNPGDLVFDPMVGSGTVPKMAKQSGRNWLGFDISAEYCDIARRRVELAQPPLFVMQSEQIETGIMAEVGQ